MNQTAKEVIFIGGLLLLVILFLPLFSAPNHITNITCIGSYCTVITDSGESHTGIASAMQGKYVVGECLYFGKSNSGKCPEKPTTSVFEMITGIHVL